ncbi:MAG: hypothetical protein M0C28_45275 [Candidatus Moduliflexus flocculans]|nr:hypothetical protein [Candidatus Moduliflexus flocculans]
MPFAAELDGYILSPYFDFLSYFFDRRWKAGAGDIVSLMIKFADAAAGGVRNGRIRKPLVAADRDRLAGAVRLAEDVLARLGIPAERTFRGLLNAGHPGGHSPDRGLRRLAPRRPAAGERLRRRLDPLPRRARQSPQPDHHGPGPESRPDRRRPLGLSPAD